MTDDLATGPYRSVTVSFAQRSGRLKDRQQRAWDSLAPRFVIDVPRQVSRTSVDPGFVLDATEVFGREAPLVVEVGTGQGEAITEAAAADEGRNYLGLEVYRPGMAQTLQRVRRLGLENVRLVQVDAASALRTLLPAGTADELWTFFPDPWHKSRHTKRRLVTQGFAETVSRVLADGAPWRLATDWAEYATQIRRVLDESPDLTATPDTSRFAGRTLTSFERKGLERGRVIHDVTAVRVPRGDGRTADDADPA